MKKEYNRDVMSDMPIDASFSQVQSKTPKTSSSKTKTTATTGQKRSTITARGSNKSASSTNKKTSTAKKSSTTKQTSVAKGSLRTKLVNSSEDVKDLEKINEENIKVYRFKSKRNRVFIVLLSVLLAVSIASIATFMVITKLKTNCNLYIHGNVNASFIVDGMEINEFRSPSNLQGNRVFKFDLQVKINNDDYYNIYFTPKCYQKGVLMANTLVYEHNTELFYDGGNGYYYSIEPIRGNQTIRLCGGIILDYDYENSLNVDNFKLDFHVYFERI